MYKALEKHDKKRKKKCLINQWCGTGKTRTFTVRTFVRQDKLTVIVFPSLGLINQYNNDYIASKQEPFKSEFKKYKKLSFCSEDESAMVDNDKTVTYTTDEQTLSKFLKKKTKKPAIVTVTYQSFEKFVNVIINETITINRLIYDEAHHAVGEKIQSIVFHSRRFNRRVKCTEFWTATPVNRNGISMDPMV